LLGDPATELLVEALDLIHLGSAGVLEAGLLLADLVELGDELLAALLGGGGLVLVLVRLGELDLFLDRILEEAGISFGGWSTNRLLYVGGAKASTYIFGHYGLVLLLGSLKTLLERLLIGLGRLRSLLNCSRRGRIPVGLSRCISSHGRCE